MCAQKHPILGVLILGVLAMTLLFSLPAAANGILHARVSFESGGAMVRGTSDDDWSFATLNSLILPGDDIWVDSEGLMEMEFAGGTFLRAADQSRLRVTEVPPQAVLEGTTGSFYIQRISRSTGSLLFKTPAADIVIDQDSHVRIDVVGQGATTVTTRWGEARILTAASGPVAVRAGQRVYVDPGLLPSAPVAINRNEMDAFDTWSADRARTLAMGDTAVPQAVTVTPTTMGYRELATQGTWVYVDNTPYWRPTVVDYVPYRYGHWSHSSAYGYSWVGNYSFCYVTSHYGRWRHHSSHGWIWTYRETWAPAWVFSARYGPNYVWAPLDPWDRPVTYGSAFYSVGSHRLSIYASSYAPVSALHYGPVPVYAVTPVQVTNINVTQINIWNIYGGGTNYNRSPRYSRGHLDRFSGADLPVRDYNPRRSIRGPEVDTRTNTVARSIASRLQQSTQAASIEQGRSVPSRSVRTVEGGASRTAQVRQPIISTDRAVRVTQSDSAIGRRSVGDPTTATRGVRGTDGIPARGGETDRALRSPSAGERPIASRSTSPVEGREVTGRGDVTGRGEVTGRGVDTRNVGARSIEPGGTPRTREVTSAPPSARTGRTIDSISTTPGARSGSPDSTRGVRESAPAQTRQAPQAQSRQPVQAEPRVTPQTRQPAQTQPRVTPQTQTRQPVQAQPQTRQPAQAQPRVTPQTQTRQPVQAQPQTRQPVQAQPRVTPQTQTRQPVQAQPQTRQPVQAQPRVTPQTQTRQPVQAQPRQAPQIQTQPSPIPQIQTRQAPQAQQRQAPPVQQRQAPQVQQRQAPQVQQRQAPQVQPRQAPQVQPRQAPSVQPRQAPQVQQRQAPQVQSRQAPQVQQRSFGSPSTQAPSRGAIGSTPDRGTSARGR